MANGSVLRPSLAVGALLAEGGEGRVFELVGRPGELYKEYRRPTELTPMEELVAWPVAAGLALGRLQLLRRSSAWPSAVVAGEGPDTAVAAGLVLPRAPRRFSVRHRDGVARLATLSYLTADPVRPSAAYGVALPASADPVRVGLVYALARLLEVFEAARPALGHGDLSAKNVLWSTQRGPEVFVLDCDNGERFGPGGVALGPPGRRRAMTPNWDDPTVAPGDNPGLAADQYSLGLIFLRVVGAGHFPVQKRQRAGEAVELAVDLPPATGRMAVLAPDAPLWRVVGRSLGADCGRRPPASTWAAALAEVLVGMGAADVLESVHRNQGCSEPTVATEAVAGPAAPDVTVAPRAARPRPVRVAWSGRGAVQGGGPADGGGRAALVGRPAGAGPVAAAAPPVGSQLRALLARAVAAWLLLHRRAARSLRSSGRLAEGARRVVVCTALDVALACLGLLLVAMVVSPFLGI